MTESSAFAKVYSNVRPNRLLILSFDFLILAFVLIWLAGGLPVPWRAKPLLAHGADPRRIALIIAIAGYVFSPKLREASFFLTRAHGIWEAIRDRPSFRWKCLVGAAVYAAALGALQSMALRYPMYDVGIFHQILWGLAHGAGFNSTISGAGNFLLDHLSPTLALLTPFYFLTGSAPWILPILHALLIFGGVAAWIYLAERLPQATDIQRRVLAAATLIFALSFDSLWANLRWGFHENSIAFASTSWALALLLTGRASRWWVLALALVTAFSKEILLLNVGLGFFVWAFWKRSRFSLLLLALGAALFACFAYFQTQVDHPADKNYFIRYYSYLGNDFPAFLRTLFLEPYRIIEAVGLKDLTGYFFRVFLPWLMLPWVGLVRNRHAFLLIIAPSFMSAALATYPPLRGAQFHYVLELWPVLAVASLWVLRTFSHGRVWVGAWMALGMVSCGQDPWGSQWEYLRGAVAMSEVRAQMESIPNAASVASDELGGSWISGRLKVTRWPDLRAFEKTCPDWLVLVQNSAEPGMLLETLRRCGLRVDREVGGWRFYRRFSSQ